MNSKYIYTSFLNKSRKTDDFDTEKFITEIQKRECIWNVISKSYSLKCYRNRETKKKAWEEIGKMFTTNWDSLSAEEKQKRVDTLTKKWSNLRKYYTDEVRRPQTESPVKKKSRRRYHNLLTFLDDSVLRRRTQRVKEQKNIKQGEANHESSSDSESNELCIVEDAKELEKLSQQYSNTPTRDVTGPYPVEFTNTNSRSSQIHLSSVSNIENTPTNKHTSNNNPEIIRLLNDTGSHATLYMPSNDTTSSTAGRQAPINVLTSLNKTSSLDLTAEATKKFLLSLLPEVMSLNVKQNMQFRLGILDLLNYIKFRVNQNT